MAIIEVKTLSKSFSVKEKGIGLGATLRELFFARYRAIEAVQNVSFKVEQGEILAFIGPNGAGKSTTIKMLTGILHPTSGEFSVLGFYPPRDRQKLAFHIATVFGQRSQLSIHLPPMDSFALLSRIYELERTEFQARFEFLVECFELKELLQVPVRKLSLGQRMRCEIAASLLHRPKVLFLDEPTIGLDVIAKNRIREVIKFLNEQEKVTVFLTSHDAGDIEALAKRTIVINHGTVVFDDLTEVFKRNYIKTKTVELVVAGGTDKFRFDEGRVLEKSDFNLKVELPGSIESIERLFHYAFENFEVQDINIFEPAMEEIIAAIYRQKKTV